MKKLTLVSLIAAALVPAVANAHKAGDVLVRAGSVTVMPHESSSNVLGLGEFNVSNDTQLGLTASYMVTNSIGIELLAATPFKHKVGLGPLGNIAEAKHLPPSLMVQYYLFEDSAFRPYAGIGVNYTRFFSEEFYSNAKAIGLHDLKLSDSWGFAAQMGMDYTLANNIIINASVWWMDISTDVKFKDDKGKQQKYKTDLDPWSVMLGVGYNF